MTSADVILCYLNIHTGREKKKKRKKDYRKTEAHISFNTLKFG